MTYSPHPPDSPAVTRRSDLLATGAVLAALVLVVVAGCTSATKETLPTVRDKIAETSIAKKTKLNIGVYEDVPLMGFVDNAGNRSGFEIDLARGIAKFLGFEESRISWVKLTTSDRETALLDGRADLVVASFSITDKRKERVRFAGPYLVTKQAVLIRTEDWDTIKEIDDLSRSSLPVCVSGATTTKAQLEAEGVRVATLTRREDCVAGLLNGKYSAMSSDRTILAGFRSRNDKKLAIVEMPFGGDELLGVGVPKHDEVLEQLVTHYLHQLYQAERDGNPTDWQVAYRSNLYPWLGAVGQPHPDGTPLNLGDQDVRNSR